MAMFTGMQPPGKKTKDLVFVKELIDAGKLRLVIGKSYQFE